MCYIKIAGAFETLDCLYSAVSEFNKVNVYENVASTLIKIGGRVGNLMDTTHDAMSPDSPMGKEISKTEKDQIYKAINEVEEKIAKLKLSIK